MSKETARSITNAFLEDKALDGIHCRCPHCGTVTNLLRAGAASVETPATFNGQNATSVLLGTCLTCRKLIVGIRGIDCAEIIYPRDIRPDNAPTGLEQEIKATYDEARKVLPISAKAAAVMARRCIQEVIRGKLCIKKDTLFKEIEEAVKDPRLSRPASDCLDHVRQIGNWGAHPCLDQSDAMIDVEPAEAEYTIEVCEMLFDDLYVATSKAAEMKARIDKKKKG